MEYPPIVRAMAQAYLSKAARLKIKRKMDIAYIITKENLGSYSTGELEIIELAIAMTIYDHNTYCDYQCNNTFNN